MTRFIDIHVHPPVEEFLHGPFKPYLEQLADYFGRPLEVMTTGELLPLLGTDRVRLIDAREPDAYREGHLPGAVNIHPSAIEHAEIHEEMRPKIKQVHDTVKGLEIKDGKE